MENNTQPYKWRIITACFLMIFICLGFYSGTRSLFLAPTTKALGIKRSEFALSNTFRNITTALVSFSFGTLFQKLGAKKLIIIGLLSLIVSSLVFAAAETVLFLCIAGVFMGFGLVFASTTMASTLIQSCCKTNIGKYTGIVLAANGVGTAIATQIYTPIISTSDSPFAYRNAYYLSAVIVGIILIIICLLLGKATFSTVTPKSKGKLISKVSFKTKAIRNSFYIVAASIFLTGFIIQGIYGIFAAYLTDIGLASEKVATVFSIFSIALTIAKVLIGAIFDRFGLRWMMIISYICAIIAIILMIIVASAPVLAFACAITLALATPLETIGITLITRGVFGSEYYNGLIGKFMAMNYAGYAIGAPVINIFYDISGSYNTAFILYGCIMVLVFVAMQFVANSTKNVMA